MPAARPPPSAPPVRTQPQPPPEGPQVAPFVVEPHNAPQVARQVLPPEDAVAVEPTGPLPKRPPHAAMPRGVVAGVEA